MLAPENARRRLYVHVTGPLLGQLGLKALHKGYSNRSADMGWVQCILCCGREPAVVPPPQQQPPTLQPAHSEGGTNDGENVARLSFLQERQKTWSFT